MLGQFFWSAEREFGGLVTYLVVSTLELHGDSPRVLLPQGWGTLMSREGNNMGELARRRTEDSCDAERR